MEELIELIHQVHWYDYSAKRYANIVTVNDNEVASIGYGYQDMRI